MVFPLIRTFVLVLLFLGILLSKLACIFRTAPRESLVWKKKCSWLRCVSLWLHWAGRSRDALQEAPSHDCVSGETRAKRGACSTSSPLAANFRPLYDVWREKRAGVWFDGFSISQSGMDFAEKNRQFDWILCGWN